ncbi:MAG: DDE-type integrase/transposase/recombinase, partial [Congregibacter sp.]
MALLLGSADEYLQAASIPSGHHQPRSTHKAGQTLWLYYRFNLSHRDIEDLLAERGITVSQEAIRLWCPKHSLRSWGRLCIKFSAIYTRLLKRKHRGYGDTFFIDDVFVKINGKQHYLWRAVDQESLPHERSECLGHGEVVDVFLQAKRVGAA